MADTIAVSALITKIRRKADIENSNVCTDAELITYINSAFKEMYNAIVLKYENYYVTSGSISVVSGTATYALPADFLKLLGIDRGSSGSVISLKPYAFQQRNSHGGAGGFYVNERYRYILQGANVKFVPTPTTTETLTIWYVPVPTAITSSAQTVDMINGFDEFITEECAGQVMRKQNLGGEEYFAKARLKKAEIIEFCAMRDANEPDSVEDHYIGRMNESLWPYGY